MSLFLIFLGISKVLKIVIVKSNNLFQVPGIEPRTSFEITEEADVAERRGYLNICILLRRSDSWNSCKD